MVRRKAKSWHDFLSRSRDRLLSQPPLRFSQMKPSALPKTAGVYLITKVGHGRDIPYYVGRTTNISTRLCKNHLRGSLRSAPLKRYLIDNGVCSTPHEAKEFIRTNCAARWIEEKDYRRRGAIEGFCVAVLFPDYGIDEEH